MSYQNAERIPLSPKQGIFSGGYVDNVQNLDLAPHYSPYLRNARLEGQSIIIRPGHSLFETLTAGSYPKGIGSYLRADPANDVLVVRHNKDADEKLVTITAGGTQTDINTGALIASNNRMSFVNVGDVIYCMNGSDLYGKLSNTTYSNPSTGVANLAPAFGVVFNSSMWVSGRSTNPNKVYKSVADNYEDFNSSGADTFTFQESITSLSANTEALFYFTKNTISVTGFSDIADDGSTVSYLTRPLTVKEGAVNNASTVEAGNRIYFVTPSNKICMIARGQSIDGFEVLELSERKYQGISTLMNSLDSNQADSFGYFLPKENIIKRFFKTAGATFNDICIVYDIGKDSFLVDTQKYFYDGIHFKGVNYTVSMIEEKVFKDEYGQDDEDAAIPFEYWTKAFYISDPTLKKCFWESRSLVDINELAELTQTIYVNGVQVDSKTIDSDNIPVTLGGIGVDEIAVDEIGTGGEEGEIYVEVPILRTRGNLNVKGRTIQRRFTNSSLAGKVRLKDINLKAEVLGELATDLTD